jgi:Protein of unknown function (DUF4232)
MLTFSPALRALPLVAAAVLLTGCGSAAAPHPGAVPGAPSSRQAQPAGAGASRSGAASPGQAGQGGAGGTGGTGGTGGLATCRAASLRVTVSARQAGGAAGSIYYPVDFTNVSRSACGMYGYPGVSFVTSNGGAGRQIGAAAQRDPAFGKLAVRLPAGGVAHAWLQVAQAGNYPAFTCQPVRAHWLRVFAPGQTVPSFVSYSLDACASAAVHLLTVMPVRAGQAVQGKTP